ncbi:MAG: glycosyltransferase [Oscillospiraceae bacterium]|nr:glycosyltransferase [Oscillospiraceae bacterium]
MLEHKNFNRLKEHILSEAISARLKEELLNNTGASDFFAVFLSVCDKKERARVFRGRGSTLNAAFENAEKNLISFYIKNKKLFKGDWVKADVVTSFETIPTAQLNSLMVNERWTNFLRTGISFTPDFSCSFLEAELNGNKVLTYYTEKEYNAKKFDYNSCRINLENLNRYLKIYYGAEPVKQIPKKITIFTARGFFCNNDEDGVIHELYNDSMDYGRRRIPEVDASVVKNIIVGASRFLAEQIDSGGRFIYGYYPAFNRKLSDYNIVRHASSLWSLINLYRMSGDKSLVPKLDAAIDYMATYIEHKDAYTAYLVEKKSGEIKLGANGVAIIMFTEYMDVFMSQKYTDIVRKLANGILELQNPTSGEYWHILSFPGFIRKDEYRTVYYDGEATFALARAYTYSKEQKYLDAAKAAVENFIAKDYTKHRDHWVAYSLFEVTKYVDDVRYYEFALRNAEVNLSAIYNRATSFHTYLEMLMASWRTYQRAVKYAVKSDYIMNYDPSNFAKTIYFRARHMLNGYFYPEYAMYMKSPSDVVGSFMVRHHNFRIRIDDIQHFIGGYFFYNLYYSEIRNHLTDEFIKSLDATPAVSELAEVKATALPSVSVYDVEAVFHLNKDFGGELTAVEQRALSRHAMFKAAGINSKLVTLKHNLNPCECMKKYSIGEDEYLNVYDYFQHIRHFKQVNISLEDLFPHTIYKWKKFTFEDEPEVSDYKIYLSKKRIAYAHYVGETLVYINRFDSVGRKTKRSYYDSRGFLSVEKYLDKDEQVILETFFSPDGKKVLEKHYHDIKDGEGKPVLSAIRFKEGKKWRVLQNEDELTALFLDSVLNSKKDLIIVDKNALYIDALKLMKKKVRKAAVIHNRHTGNNEVLTGNIISSYRELFNSLGEFSALVTFTDKQRQEIIRRYNNADKIFAIPEAVPKLLHTSAPSSKAANAPKIITVAEFDQHKRLSLSLLAFSEVIKKLPQAELHLIGYSDEDNEVGRELRELVSALGLEDNVRFRGFVPDMQSEYASAKLYVLTSLYEVFPTELLNAMAHGLPAVSFDIKYGVSELIEDGKTGFLTAENPDELAKKMLLLLTNEAKYEEFSTKAYNKSQSFSEEQFIKKWKKLFLAI